MKQNISRSFLLLHWPWRISFAVLLCTIQIFAQQGQQTPPEFPVGVFSTSSLFTDPDGFPVLDELGVNYVVEEARSTNQTNSQSFNLIASNASGPTDVIYHYSNAIYKRWEAEIDNSIDVTGFKHTAGTDETYNGAVCWTTGSLSQSVEKLLYGPSYYQQKKYKLIYTPYRNEKVSFKVRFRIAFKDNTQLNPNTEVCSLYVMYGINVIVNNWYSDEYIYIPLGDENGKKTLTVADFPTDDFYIFELTYTYPDSLVPPTYNPSGDGLLLPASQQYADDISKTGIEFRLDWRGVGKLYIDYVEVFDIDNGDIQGIGNYFTSNHSLVITEINQYLSNYNTTDWGNIKYWYVLDEPTSLDYYYALGRVEELVDSLTNGSRHTITEFYPHWDGIKNGDPDIQTYVDLIQPYRLMIDYYPFHELVPVPDYLELLRARLQECSIADEDFWYVGQGFGQKLNLNEPDYCGWRKPTAEELNSSVMLALSHGSKGILFWKFFTENYNVLSATCPDGLVYFDCIVGLPETNYERSPLFDLIKENLAPRLKGKLGKTLLSLDYTGDYIPLYCNGCPNHDTPSADYLTLDCEATNFHWHCGFFTYKDYPDNKYFLLTNLRTTQEVTAILTILNNTAYQNLRFANVEGGIDTTISYNASMPYYDSVPAGEGKLYQVAPVVKYGGKLIYPETISSTTTLHDEMVIKNGAILTVNSTYNVYANIIVKAGGRIVTTGNGTIKFYQGNKLIVEGAAILSGTTSNKLKLDFTNPINSNGIIIKPGALLNISYCEIKNAVKGINSELNANYINAQYVDFIDCDSVSINILGRSPGQAPTPPPQINNCTMLNSNYGIFITNLPVMLIQNNIITNNACGIYLSNVTDAQIIGNGIYSSTEALEGIISISSGGVIRGNGITGHTVGIHLANSSPKLGGNRIYYNRYHGLYIGSGSRPNMRSELAGNPPITYAISGYNEIKENGGYVDDGGPEDNDGSEIYFVNSNALMVKGCNLIYDDREPESPLVNTYLLMNCPAEGHPIYVDARGNYWGYRVEPGRFGNLIVDYIPYNEQPCPEPQSADGEFVLMTSFGDIIDTVYSIDVEIPEMTETEEAYAGAEEYFLTGDLTNALQIYESIINSNSTEEEKYLAYERKYSIGKITGQSSEYFNDLSSTFSTLASNTLDTLNAKILNQLSTLSKVGEQEYETAIGEFDVVIQQNPNTEEAVYAEIDALTAALLIEEADSSLQKGKLGKYLVKTSGDYNQRVDEILRKNFGSESKENQKELLPTEYTLYQNYPNPFNPTTTIKYDLPNTSDVSLVIYDILGRKVKTLVNENQQAGRYEVQFNASALASGVYIYQLIADNPSTSSGQGFISSKKMILLK